MANVSVSDRQPEAVWGAAQFFDRCCLHTSLTPTLTHSLPAGGQVVHVGLIGWRGGILAIYVFGFCDGVIAVCV